MRIQAVFRFTYLMAQFVIVLTVFATSLMDAKLLLGGSPASPLKSTTDSTRFSSKATLPPKRKMVVLEFEIGIEIGSRAFQEKSAYGGNLEKAQASANSTIPNLDARYLHATGIKHTLGKVIIRTDPSKDPLRGKVTETGGGGKARQSLAAFKNYWNQNPQIVGKSHDLAAYHTYFAPSGLAYVKSVGSSQRYATVGGRGPTSWANGTLCHEFGHSWGLKHTNDSGLFYESAPRDKKGATSAGGESRPLSIMVGNSKNIGRLASDEAEVVMATRNAKHNFGVIYNPKPTKPFGKRDAVVCNGKAVVIDVVENDYDVNNDVLDVALLDTVSHQGGRISLSKATGPGGRNEIKYVPPQAGMASGEDFFHYTVFDSTGLTDFGAVYVRSNSINVDLTATEYHYDFGTEESPVEPKFTRVTPETEGDIRWGRPVYAADRGPSREVNKVNQDFVFGDKPVVLHHKISNGIWVVTLNMGDSDFGHDRMGIAVEGRRVNKNINSPKGQFSYVSGNGKTAAPREFRVEVKDGQLDLKFFDAGGEDPHWVVNRMSLVKETE